MNNGHNSFKRISDEEFKKQKDKPDSMVFKTGEILEIRGSRFRLMSIQRKKMILKLLPQLNHE